MLLHLWLVLSLARAEDLPSVSVETPRRFQVDGVTNKWAQTRPVLVQVPEAARLVRGSRASRVVADTALVVAITGIVAGAVHAQNLDGCSEPGLVEIVCVDNRQEEGVKLQIGSALVPGLLIQAPFRLASRSQRRSAVDAYTRVAHPEEVVPEGADPPEATPEGDAPRAEQPTDEDDWDEEPPAEPREEDEP